MLIFLSGMMGTGKSTVGKALGRTLGVPFIDLDQQIETRAKKTIQELFAEQGEENFRDLEESTLQQVLSDYSAAVLALGGGTVLRQSSRRLLLNQGWLFTLTASAEQILARVSKSDNRPLLSRANVKQVIEELIKERASAYAECHAEIDAQAPIDEIVRRIQAELQYDRVVVPLGVRSYRVFIGNGNLDVIPRLIAEGDGPSQILLSTDSQVLGHWVEPVRKLLREHIVQVVSIQAGEAHKNLDSVRLLWEHALQAELDRQSLIVGIGGGVVGDLTAFVASTYMRGIALAQVPTTLLAMVDSAVGGKTGFDCAQGKNLIGTFYQPRWVVCDLSTLQTLPEEERRAGLAEVVKSAWLDSEASVSMLEQDAKALSEGEAEATKRAVKMAVALKASIVTQDEREGGIRAYLNLGHTLAHAIEAAEQFQGLRHGHAVAVGMVAAAQLSEQLGFSDASQTQRMRELLEALGLPVDPKPYLNERTLAYLGHDKKRGGNHIKYVLPLQPGTTKIQKLELTQCQRALQQLGA